jgi:hypothetical protein
VVVLHTVGESAFAGEAENPIRAAASPAASRAISAMMLSTLFFIYPPFSGLTLLIDEDSSSSLREIAVSKLAAWP